MRVTKELKNHNAITLIALVITIIVMLILAGVSIAMLTGENGVLTQASNAKDENRKKEAIERAQVDILGVQAENEGKLTKSQFIEVVEKFFDDVPAESELPDDMSTAIQNVTAKEEYGSYEIKISEIWNGKFSAGNVTTFDPETLEIGTAINSDMYGMKVGNYNKKLEETGGWRLFFQDRKYTYLISENPTRYYHYAEGIESYEDGSDVSIVGQRLNKMLLDKGTFFVETNTNTGIKQMAFLTDTSDSAIWSQYKNEDAVFAIGSPTIELYKASFDATATKNGATNFAIGTSENGYTVNTENGQLKKSYSNGIYNYEGAWPSAWWIASVWNVSEVFYLYGGGENFGVSRETEYMAAARPVVCIPTSVFESKYQSSLVPEE